MIINNKFLPVSKKDLKDRNIDILDFIIVTGDAYVDHPSFGTAIIGRVLENEGFNVGVIAQPDWLSDNDFLKLGRPKYAFIVNSGNIDSMVNHYTAAKKLRHDDIFSPGGKGGKRPDRAVIVYCNKIKQLFKNTPIVIGGIEASLRRFAHYDYWDDKVRRSILIDSKANLLCYGMGEKTMVQICNLLKYGKNINDINDLRGTVFITKDLSKLNNYIEIPSFEDVSNDKKSYADAFKTEMLQQDPYNGKSLAQKHNDHYIVQNPPQIPLTENEMDLVYSLPFVRTYHPCYEADGGVPSIKEVKFSITSHRGCFGGCSFCALTFHQGKIIQKRSAGSIIEEEKLLTTFDDFKGYIHDVGGPTANFRNAVCKLTQKHIPCKRNQCLYPDLCKNLIVDHREYTSLLKKMRTIPGVKKVFIRSGIRYDYLMKDTNDDFFKELCEYHISGQLKVAPEHINNKVLAQMGKPSCEIYNSFRDKFFKINKQLNKEQYLVPYLISSHPGSDINAAIELSLYIKEMGYMPEQVQDFYPTPGTLSTAMYYTGINPMTGDSVYVPKSAKEKNEQRALLQYSKPQNYKLVHAALDRANRLDLIGYEKNCLIKPYAPKKITNRKGTISSKLSDSPKNEKHS